MLPIGDYIYLRRLEKGMSQTELAAKSRMPQSNLSTIEKGKRDITVSTLRKIAAALDAHPRDFFEDWKPDKIELSRSKIEHLAKIVSGKAKSIKPAETELTDHLKNMIPRRGRKYVKDINRSWLELRKRLSSSEIGSICERSDEYRRRNP